MLLNTRKWSFNVFEYCDFGHGITKRLKMFGYRVTFLLGNLKHVWVQNECKY